MSGLQTLQVTFLSSCVDLPLDDWQALKVNAEAVDGVHVLDCRGDFASISLLLWFDWKVRPFGVRLAGTRNLPSSSEGPVCQRGSPWQMPPASAIASCTEDATERVGLDVEQRRYDLLHERHAEAECDGGGDDDRDHGIPADDESRRR